MCVGSWLGCREGGPVGRTIAIGFMLAGLLAPTEARWLARTSLGSLGLQVGPSTPSPDIVLGVPRFGCSVASVALGHSVVGRLGAGYSGVLAEAAYSLASHNRYYRLVSQGPFLSWGAAELANGTCPAVTLLATAGVGNDGEGSWLVSARLGLVAEWRLWNLVTPAVMFEWSEIGPAASASLGIGGWWAFGP